MANGGGPPDRLLANSDYQDIKNGTLITEGTYAGCIKVASERIYWVTPNDETWRLETGEPDEDQCPIPEAVWDRCKDGGTYTWDGENEHWADNGNNYRWAADEGDDIELKEV